MSIFPAVYPTSYSTRVFTDAFVYAATDAARVFELCTTVLIAQRHLRRLVIISEYRFNEYVERTFRRVPANLVRISEVFDPAFLRARNFTKFSTNITKERAFFKNHISYERTEIRFIGAILKRHCTPRYIGYLSLAYSLRIFPRKTVNVRPTKSLIHFQKFIYLNLETTLYVRTIHSYVQQHK